MQGPRNRDAKLQKVLARLKKLTCAICENGFRMNDEDDDEYAWVLSDSITKVNCDRCSRKICTRLGCCTYTYAPWRGMQDKTYCTDCQKHWCYVCGLVQASNYNKRCEKCERLMCKHCISGFL